MSNNTKRILFVPDVHVPYHNEEACCIMWRAAHFWRPEIIVLLGDLADFYSVSFFDKSPERRKSLQDELSEVNRALEEFEHIGAKTLHYIMGNHEHRMSRYIASKAPELHGLFNWEEHLKLKQRGWKITKYKESLQLGKLRITHDLGKSGKDAHIKARNSGNNVVLGHTHHMGVDYCGNPFGDVRVGAVFGWLGDSEQVDYVHRDSAKQWPLGFGTGVMEPSGVVHLQAHPIVNRKVCIAGEIIK